MAPSALAELARTYESVPLGRGGRLHVLSTAKWKTVFVDVFLRRDLDERAAALALLPNLLRRGTRRVPDLRAMTRRLESLYGASIASDILKVGESQVLLARLEIAHPRHLPGEAPVLALGLDLLSDVLFDPRVADGAFAADWVEQEKRNLANAIQGLQNDKTAYATERCCQEMCAGEPFALYEYGRVEDVRALEPGGLYAFYREVIDRAPIDIFISGDVSLDEARSLVEPRFPLERRGDLVPRPPAPHPAPRPVREVIEERPVKQAKLVLGLRSEISARDPELAALLMANGILGGFPHSKLFRVVREREGLCYYASSSFERTKGVILVGAGIDGASYETARALIESQIEALRKGEVDDAEIANTRKAIRRSLTTAGDSASRLASHWYTGLVNGRPEAIAAAIAAIERVAPADVVAAARRLRLDTVYLLRDPRKGAAA
jgi:predicted Zn-dependent peptidase